VNKEEILKEWKEFFGVALSFALSGYGIIDGVTNTPVERIIPISSQLVLP
jgi:hypothetical protein